MFTLCVDLALKPSLMRGTFQIIKLFGIPVQVHWTFPLLILWTIYRSTMEGNNTTQTIWLSLVVITLFICVILHEFGHALTARFFGIKTRDIIVLPIGGLARLDKLPEKPFQEFLVAAAGPMVNFVIGFLLLVGWLIFNNLSQFLVGIDESNANSFIPTLISMNVLLAIFNLIPAYPMDGGRILRSILSIWLRKSTATKIASIIGQLIALFFIVIAIFPVPYFEGFQSPFFAILGVFIFITAFQEFNLVRQESKLSKAKIKDIASDNFSLLEPSDTLRVAYNILDLKKEHYFVVEDGNGQIFGVLTPTLIQQLQRTKDLETPVLELLSTDFEILSSEDSLMEAIKKYQDNPNTILFPVVEGEVVKKVLNINMIEQFMRRKN